MNSGIFALLLCPASCERRSTTQPCRSGERPQAYDKVMRQCRLADVLERRMPSFAIVPALSSTSLLLVGSTLLAFALAAAATPLVGLLARRLGMLDMPGGRRVHPRPIPRPGGLAIAVAFGTAIFVFWLIDRLAGHPFLILEEVRSSRFTLTAIAALLGMAIGLVDDLLELRARWQFLGQVIVAAVIVVAGIHIDFVNDPLSDRLIELSFPVAVA